MKIILTRHGETLGNIEGMYQGHLPGILSEKGIDQARKTSKRLKIEKIDAIFSSDLDRARHTAEKIHENHLGSPLILTEKMRERHLGKFQGMKKKDLGENYEEVFQKRKKEMKVETNESIMKRTKEFLEEIEKEYVGKTIIIVGHNGVNRALVANMLNKELKRCEGFGNCSVSVFLLNDKTFEVELYNCVKHLD